MAASSKVTFFLGVLSLSILMSNAGAESLAVRSSVLQSETLGATTTGVIEVEVYNSTGSDLRNVDLRLDHPSGALENGVLQFGAVPVGQTRLARTIFVLPAEVLASDHPLLWRVDYDEYQGGHVTTLIADMQ